MKQVKASTKDAAAGKLREVEAALEEAVGEAARNRELEVEGKVERRAGSSRSPRRDPRARR